MRVPVLVAVLVLQANCASILDLPPETKVGCPEPCLATVSGKALRADSVNGRPRSGVTVRLTSVSPPLSTTTSADGSYAFAGLARGTKVELELSWPQTDPDPGPILVTRYLAGDLAGDLAVDPPVVEYRWLAKVAYECGLFPSLEAAIYADPDRRTGVNPYFIGRSTVIAEVEDADGSPAALDRGDVTVLLDGYPNFHQNPTDILNPPATAICFLEADALGSFTGVNTERSDQGRFVVFRARNVKGTGTGPAEIRVASYPVGRVNLSSASIGFVRIKLVPGAEVVPPRPRSFARDVYPIFGTIGCTTCHKPGGIGFMTAPVRPGTDGKDYPADYSGTPAEVFDVLTKPSAVDCDRPGSPARVCTAAPAASLIYSKPREEGGGQEDHQGIALPADNPALTTILQWISDGARP